jgi:hypothetical protein
MEAITERIEIINSFYAIYDKRVDSTARRIKASSILFYFYLALSFLFTSIVLISIVGELTSFNSKFTWNSASMSILFSITTLINSLKGFFSMMLLKHLSFLENSTLKNVDEHLNIELRKIITANNKPMGTNVLIISLAIMTLVGTIINFFMDNQFIYYKFFILPTLLFYILSILEAVKTYQNIKANIDEVENTTHQPSFNIN